MSSTHLDPHDQVLCMFEYGFDFAELFISNARKLSVKSKTFAKIHQKISIKI